MQRTPLAGARSTITELLRIIILVCHCTRFISKAPIFCINDDPVYWLTSTLSCYQDDVKRGTLSSYWKQLASVILASSLMFIFDLCERSALRSVFGIYLLESNNISAI